MPASDPQHNPFRGVYAASLIPLHTDLSIDCRELADHYHSLIAKGVKGMVLFGSSGEGPSFSIEERKKALQALIPLGVDPQRCIVGVICASLMDAVELACCAVENRYLAVMMIPPFYYKTIDDMGVTAFYREAIRRINHPNLHLLLYHIPQISGVPISINCIETLLQEFPKTILGLKESEGNLPFAIEVIKRFPNFHVFVGNETQVSDAVRAGGAGSIAGMTNIIPDLIQSLYEFGCDPSKPNRNEEIQTIMAIMKNYPLLPAMKSLMEKKRGERWHALRPPFMPLEKEQSLALQTALARFLR